MIGGATDISGSAAVTRLSDIGADLATDGAVVRGVKDDWWRDRHLGFGGGHAPWRHRAGARCAGRRRMASSQDVELRVVGQDLAGSFEVSKMIGGARHLGFGGGHAPWRHRNRPRGSFEVSKMIGGATDILGSAAVTRLDIGTDFAQLLEASKAIHTSATYMRAGFSPGLIAFPHATYDKVLFGAEFQLSFSSIPIPQPIDLPDPDSAFNSRHWEIFVQLEQRLPSCGGTPARISWYKLDRGKDSTIHIQSLDGPPKQRSCRRKAGLPCYPIRKFHGVGGGDLQSRKLAPSISADFSGQTRYRGVIPPTASCAKCTRT